MLAMSKREGNDSPELVSASKTTNQLQSSCLKTSFPSNLLTLSSWPISKERTFQRSERRCERLTRAQQRWTADHQGTL